MSVPIAAPDLGAREMSRVLEVIGDGRLADGPVVRSFEDAFSGYCDAEHGVATANGTAALHAALRAAGISAGDRVITSPFSFVASANAIRLAGGQVLFADVDQATYAIDPVDVRGVVEAHDGAVDAILAVHLYGLPAPMGALREIAEEYDLALIEDACQAHGATVGGRPVGSLGDAAAFSFYPTKNATTGEGGMVVTDDDEVAARARRFVNHGRAEAGGGYEHAELGHNFRLASLGAAIGTAQLRKLPRYVEARRRHAARYDEALEATPAVESPTEPPGMRHVYHQYTVRTRHRDDLQAYLEDADVDTAIYYPTPIHRQPAYDLHETYPVAEDAARQVLSIPVHPTLTEAEVERIAGLLEAYEP